MNPRLSWMVQPFAHRGLHDASIGIVENTRSAVEKAKAHGYGSEVDLRLAACGSVMVFHDAELSRLTHEDGLLAEHTKSELQAIRFKDTSDVMMSLDELLQIADGQMPLLLEIKSDETPEDGPIVQAVIDVVRNYAGPFAVMSFDPKLIATFARQAPHIARGLVSERFSDLSEWFLLSFWQRWSRRLLLSAPGTRPDFIAYDVNALPDLGPLIARHLFHRPLLTWTVRTPLQRERARKYADAIIFESFRP